MTHFDLDGIPRTEEEYGKGRQDLDKFKQFCLHVPWWRRFLRRVRCPRCSTRMWRVVKWAWKCEGCGAVLLFKGKEKPK